MATRKFAGQNVSPPVKLRRPAPGQAATISRRRPVPIPSPRTEVLVRLATGVPLGAAVRPVA